MRRPIPDTALRRVKGVSGDDLVYTIARNRSHTSVEYIFAEGVELEPSEDTLQIARGIASSRPNLLLVVGEEDLDEFVAAWKARAGRRKLGHVRRTMGRALDPIGTAVLDRSRYVND